MVSTLSPSEEGQLAQTIEMFEVITQSQPQDYQSLEILKEAYSKLGRQKDVISTSKRIAEAYVQMGQLSSAILEYETVLQRFPDDPDVQAALSQIESRANNFPISSSITSGVPSAPEASQKRAGSANGQLAQQEVDDGREMMYKLFVDSKVITPGDFDLCWSKPDMTSPPTSVTMPFVQLLADKGILQLEQGLRIVSDKSRAAFLPLQLYDIDIELARTFPSQTCRRWCILPFDRMSKSVLVATANPFNIQAAKELAGASGSRLVWYLAPPMELVNCLRKAFR